jgi:hypothetical protein
MYFDDRLEVRVVGARDLSESESEGGDPGVVAPDGAFLGGRIEIRPPFSHRESLRRTGQKKHKKKQETPSPKRSREPFAKNGGDRLWVAFSPP